MTLTLSIILDLFIIVFGFYIIREQIQNLTFIDGIRKFRLKDKTYVNIPKLSIFVLAFLGTCFLLWKIKTHISLGFNIDFIIFLTAILGFISFLILITYCLFIMIRAIYLSFNKKELTYKDGYYNKNLIFYDIYWVIFGVFVFINIIIYIAKDFIKLFQLLF